MSSLILQLNCCLWICYKSSWPGQNGIVLFINLIKIISHNIKHEIYTKIVKCQKLGTFIWIDYGNIVTLIPREERNKETYGTDTQDLLRYLYVAVCTYILSSITYLCVFQQKFSGLYNHYNCLSRWIDFRAGGCTPPPLYTYAKYINPIPSKGDADSDLLLLTVCTTIFRPSTGTGPLHHLVQN